MGGTTAKAGVIHNGEALTTGSALIGGMSALPVQIAMMDIFEVGTGGGSIARIADEGGLRVGPQSAGAQPGPACYGQGGDIPTVTDANVYLGKTFADRLFWRRNAAGSGRRGHRNRQQGSWPAGHGHSRCSSGDSPCCRHRYVPRGQGCHHGTRAECRRFRDGRIWRRGAASSPATLPVNGIREVFIPHSPGHFSAFGMLFSDLRYDYVRSRFTRFADMDFSAIEKIYRELEAEGIAEIEKVSAVPERIVVSRAADMRYVGQEHSVTVDLAADLFANEERAGIKERFDAVHDLRYGTCAPQERSEIVSLRVTVTGMLEKPDLQRIKQGNEAPSPDAHTGVRKVRFGDERLATDTWDRSRLVSGNKIAGPALVEEHASTTVLHPGDGLTVDDYGNLKISIGSDAS